MERKPPEFMGLKRMSVDLEEYDATCAWWLARLQQWRRELKHRPVFDPSTADPFAPTQMRLARRWLPRDPEAERFVIETLALINWPGCPRERQLGCAGQRLITKLIFATSLPARGRPPRLRDLRPVRDQVRAERPAILREIQSRFRDTPTMDGRAERQAWLRTFLRKHLPGLTPTAREAHVRRLASKRPVVVANWILSRRHTIRPATLRRLVSLKSARP